MCTDQFLFSACKPPLRAWTVPCFSMTETGKARGIKAQRLVCMRNRGQVPAFWKVALQSWCLFVSPLILALRADRVQVWEAIALRMHAEMKRLEDESPPNVSQLKAESWPLTNSSLLAPLTLSCLHQPPLRPHPSFLGVNLSSIVGGCCV